MRYRVWGYTDDDPEAPTIIAAFDGEDQAIAFAKSSTMSLEVEDYETDAIVWMYESPQWASAWKDGADAR